MRRECGISRPCVPEYSKPRGVAEKSEGVGGEDKPEKGER